MDLISENTVLRTGDLLYVQIGGCKLYCTIDSLNLEIEYREMLALCKATVYRGSNGFPETYIWTNDIIQHFGQISYEEFKEKYPQRFI